MGKGVCEAFALVAELGYVLGVRKINDLPGCWEHQVDERWHVAVNAHEDERTTETGAKVPGLCVYVTFNEWPAGIFSAAGGPIAAGEAANENTLCQALKDAIARVEGDRRG